MPWFKLEILNPRLFERSGTVASKGPKNSAVQQLARSFTSQNVISCTKRGFLNLIERLLNLIEIIIELHQNLHNLTKSNAKNAWLAVRVRPELAKGLRAS
jgi:hypothetical protein